MNTSGSRHVAPSASACIVGGGIAGLASALALHRQGISATIIEADRFASGSGDFSDDRAWIDARRGAPQAFHPHFLMARLRAVLADSFPELLAELEAAGVWSLPMADTLDDRARAEYRAKAGDELLAPLCARRSTFEQVLRKYVIDRGIAELRQGCRLRELITETAEGTLIVTGCIVEKGGERSTIMADFVIDASGRGSPCLPALRGHGVTVEEEADNSGLVYLTQRYRLREGQDYPPMSGIPAAEFESFFIGAHPADNGYFTVTIGFWRDDAMLARASNSLAQFMAVASRVPKIAPWIDDQRAAPVGTPRRFGNIDYVWRSIGSSPVNLRGMFLVGDSQVRTNPKFGRGCTWAFLSALALAECCQLSDERARLPKYQQTIRNLFRQDWETMRGLDRNSLRRSRVARGTALPRLLDRWRWAIEDAILIDAMGRNASVHREIVRAYHGFTTMTAWLFAPQTWIALMRVALRRMVSRGERFGREGWPTREALAQSLQDAEA
ncbi:MAG: NAD(P)/FAD-dependent oxidoreductase [Novosphingobium sp.]